MSAHLRPDEHYMVMSVFAERSPALILAQLSSPGLGHLLNVEVSAQMDT